MKRSLWSAIFALVLAITATLTACGSGGGNGGGPGPDGGAGDDATLASDSPTLNGGDTGINNPNAILVITPAAPVVAVTIGQIPSIPTKQFTATLGGAPVSPQWTIDRGEIGTINVSSGLFTPTATLGGTANITAAYQGHMGTTTVTVDIANVSYGDPNPPDGGTGAGGFGGVGGAGEGPPATPVQIGVLNGTTQPADPNIAFLYPYDQTVFPQGILPPLLQWTTDGKAFDAILVHIKEGAYEYKGYFGAPANPFQNQPIPQAVWNAVTYSNQGEPVTVELTFAISSLNQAWGPITSTWKIAQGSLKGTIYYQSYGTALAQNLCGALPSGGPFGGATLAIHEDQGATSPVLVAGNTTANPCSDQSGCRVCHSVAAKGSDLMTQQFGGNPGDATSSLYSLTNNNTQSVPANNNGQGVLAWPALYPDGTFLFSNSGGLAGASTAASGLYSTTTGAAIASTGLPAGLGGLTPVFSPDGTHVAYNFYAGTGADQSSLAALDFALATNAFSNQRTLTTPAAGTWAYWPSFLPTNDGVVYELQTVSNGRDLAGTRGTNDTQNDTTEDGAHGELWWVDLATHTATRLDQANGLAPAPGDAGGAPVSYLPPHPTAVDPTGDNTLNYEPTVNPVTSGGYAWVVFTSRRLYGNVATTNPYWSDPRNEDLSQVANATTKKLWVAAIDLNAKPGTDPSHPAFYLPAQELLAGNARGFWVVDPCHPDGTSCLTGDECCGGYCRPEADGGLACSAVQPTCSQVDDKCATSADCCGAAAGIQCIDGLCSQPSPK